MTEHLTGLQKQLFAFAHTADHLNVELNEALLAGQSEPDTRTIFELQACLRIIARKAEYVAAKMGTESGTAAYLSPLKR